MAKSSKHPCLQPVSVHRLTGTSLPVIPCGTCPNCLKRKGSELAFRLYTQLKGRKVHLLTFTYDDKSCPIMHVSTLVDRLTGEVLGSTSHIDRDTSFFENAPFQWVQSKKKGKDGKSIRVKRYSPIIEMVPENVFTHPDTFELRESYFTVYYEDIKKMLKRFRQKSDVLTDFICVPEYGGTGYRPHYHMLVCGFDSSDIDTLVSEWPFGHVDVRQVVSLTGQQADLSAVSSYVSKYATKGKYDCPFIRSGNCLKPRRAVSQNFGLADKSKFEYLFYRQDLYPGFNPLEQDFPSILDEDSPEFLSTTRKLAEAFLLNRSVNINGYNYPIPRYIIRKLFYKPVKYYDATGKFVYRALQAVPLQREISDIVLSRLVETGTRELQKCCVVSPSISYDFEHEKDFPSIPLVDDCLSSESSRMRQAETAFLGSMLNSYY